MNAKLKERILGLLSQFLLSAAIASIVYVLLEKCFG